MQRKEVRPKCEENGPGVNKDYHNETNLEMEGQFLQTLQNGTAQMRKTISDEISLSNIREQELREKKTINVEELQKMLDQEKRERMRLEEESVVVKSACKELEERLNKLLAQMRQVLGNKMLLSVANKGNRLREKEPVLDELKKTIEQEKQARSRVEEELNQMKITCKELEERLVTELAEVQQALENEIGLRSTSEQELREKGTFLDELQKELSEERRTRSRVGEELREARNDCIKLEKRLESEREQMQRAVENEVCLRRETEKQLQEKETNAVILENMLGDEQLRKRKLEEELFQARTDHTEEKKRLENEREQMQRTVHKEIRLRRKTEQQLQEKEKNVVTLENMFEEEQLRRTRLEEELIQARTDRTEEKERLEKELAETERTLNNEKRLHDTKKRQLREKEAIMDEMQERLSESEKARLRMEEELSQVRSSRNLLTERMENELRQIRRTLDNEMSLRKTTEQELRERETIINEQRTTIEAQRREFEEELSLRRDQIETNETAQRELQRLLGDERQQRTDLEETLRNLQLEMEEEMDRRASAEREMNTATECQTHQTRDWIIQREEVVLSGRRLGRGAWGEVREGTFRSCQVAVKKIHDLILSDHNRRLFEREMTIASCCRHPNLLQFIGATNDDGNPLFVTELLDTSLRHLLTQRALNDEEIVSLALDVAKGLNYLHLNRPRPIIHRDISSANVLLWRRDESWRAKLSDYGSANFVRQSMTANPGAIIYSAPEADTSQQSPKVINYIKEKVFYLIY